STNGCDIGHRAEGVLDWSGEGAVSLRTPTSSRLSTDRTAKHGKIHRRRTVRDERETPLVGLENRDSELDRAPGETSAHTRPAARDEATLGELDDLERDRRRARDGLGLGQQLVDLLRRA